MNEQRLPASPAAALFFGVITALVWVIVLNFIYVFDTTELTLLMTTGAFGAVGGSIGTFLMSMAARRTADKLSQAEHEARHDSLTGLTNRSELFRVLELSLEEAVEHDTALGVLFLDLDRFKKINDSLGHDAGDELLRIVANRLRGAVRAEDLVARLGGDEFVVLCRGMLKGSSALRTAKQIERTIREPISLNGREQQISTSIGVAVVEPGERCDADELVSNADAAMYEAKRSKSRIALFNGNLRAEAMDRLEVERGLLKAIDQGQIIVYYQPIVNTKTRSLYGFEALVRWNHPQHGVLGPGQFLAVAEEAGLMSQIGNIVLREACAQAAVWTHQAPAARNVRMGVNLAEQQLVDANLPEYVRETLEWSGLDPSQLVLEITEDVIVDHLDSLDVLRQLKALGVTLAIDDFGTGQSSLSYVKQFDMASTIKIDQTFVRDMETESVDQAIIEAVVTMASALGFSVVAEGVERQSHMQELSSLGVDLMQGYLFSKPMAPESIDAKTWFPNRGERNRKQAAVAAG